MEYRTRWPNHSRRTRLSPKTRSKRGPSASMSIKVSFTSKTMTEGFLSFHRVRVGMLGRDMSALLPRRSIVDDHHLPAGLVRLHAAMRLADLLEAEDARRLRLQPARRHVLGDLLQRDV